MCSLSHWKPKHFLVMIAFTLLHTSLASFMPEFHNSYLPISNLTTRFMSDMGRPNVVIATFTEERARHCLPEVLLLG